jgi:predicted Zn-dependent protease
MDRRRRLFSACLCCSPLAAWAQVDVGKQSKFAKLVPAEQVEQAAAQQYAQLKSQASAKKALAPPDHPQVVRLRYIADRLIPYADDWNARAKQWKWEVALLASDQLNAFCMPGGKIAFFHGILAQLKLTDDEVAMIMGHEMAHALREHAREQMGKNAATRGVIELGSALLGLGGGGRALADIGGQLLTLRFGRDDESEADLIGMDLAARAGYDPAAGVSLWQKMAKAAESRGAPPELLSTHPSGPTRISDIERALPKVQSLYAKAGKPERRFEPPAPLRQG